MTGACVLTPPERRPPPTFSQLTGQAPTAPHLKTFPSHSIGDKTHVDLGAHLIEALGTTVYFAENDPRPGTVLVEKVRAAIHRTRTFVDLATTTSINSASKRGAPLFRHGHGQT